MSDSPQGEGWWLASDGRWYPPDAHPAGGNAPTSAASERPPVTPPAAVPGGGTVPSAGTGLDPPQPGAASPGVGFPSYAAPPPAPYGNPPSGPPPLPGTYGGYPAGMRPQRTSGLAIAALILSIVWIGGLGSLLAVVLGIVALTQIAKARGSLGGKGVSIAAVVIGGLGIVVTALVAVFVVFVVKDLVQVQTAPVGTTFSVKHDLVNEGIASMTVDQVATSPFGDNGVTPGTGRQFVFAHARICATSQGTSSFVATSRFTVATADHGSATAWGASARAPGIAGTISLGSGQCVTGWLTFAIPSSTRPLSVNYSSVPFIDFTWTIPG